MYLRDMIARKDYDFAQKGSEIPKEKFGKDGKPVCPPTPHNWTYFVTKGILFSHTLKISFPCFSGADAIHQVDDGNKGQRYRNNPRMEYVVKNGPIPRGKYYILSKTMPTTDPVSSDVIRAMTYLLLYSVDTGKDYVKLDATKYGLKNPGQHKNGIIRSKFRIHGGERSEGCITMPHNQFRIVREKIIESGQCDGRFGILSVVD
jgi:hypothetical protein